MTKVVCVGARWSGVETNHLPIESATSLLDYDLIIFTPELPPTDNKKRPDGGDRLERIQHWKKELGDAVDHGKVVIVLCPEDQEFAYVVRNVRYKASIYDALPIDLARQDRSGGAVIGARHYQRARDFLNPYVGSMSYAVTFLGFDEEYLKTRTGDLVVGGAKRFKNGVLILLPRPSLEPLPNNLAAVDVREQAIRSKTAFISAAVTFARTFKERGRSEPPEWVSALPRAEKQAQLETSISALEASRREIDVQISDTRTQLDEIQQFNDLTFETGDPLEDAVRQALVLMGFKVEKYDDGELRFDLVAESAEGRLLGEVEGKDNTHVDIDKIRQLATNIDEDYEREDVSEPALGVLFGNSFRKMALNERPPFFSDKAMNTAARRKIALVRTPDLLSVVHAIVDGGSEDFKARCRASIFEGAGGVVTFPVI